ncbi:MAG: RnfABCDGE type electron transport complex subunit D [Pseudomonadota bacterium]
MRFASGAAPHLTPTRQVIGVMAPVCIALLPAAAIHLLCFGPGLALNLASTVTVALASDLLGARWLGNAQSWHPPIGDGSAVVTALLVAFCLPPLTPIWVSASAAGIAIVLGKQLFGGLGHNAFNPAMVGYAAVLLAFPAQLAGYPDEAAGSASLAHSLSVFIGGLPEDLTQIDAMTGATPLDRLQDGLSQMMMVSEIRDADAFSAAYGPRWDLLSLSFVIGGLGLLWRGTITWHAPLGVLAGVAFTATFLSANAPDNNASTLFHLAVPSTALAAFFIATDPVSGATSPPGRFVFGLGVGALSVLIRRFGAYPDGVAYAVLLMNLIVPLIDRWTRPRVVGNER